MGEGCVCSRGFVEFLKYGGGGGGRGTAHFSCKFREVDSWAAPCYMPGKAVQSGLLPVTPLKLCLPSEVASAGRDKFGRYRESCHLCLNFTRGNRKRKRFVPSCRFYSIIKAIGTVTQGGKLEARSEAEAMEERCLLVASPGSLTLFFYSGPPAQGWHHPQ